MVARRATAPANAGFTLMEIVVAMAILAVSLFILMNGQYAALSLQDTMNTEVVFRQLLQIVVNEAEAEVYLGNLSGSDEFGTRYPDYSYAFEAVLQGEDETVPIYQVTATVFGPEGEERSLEFYVYNTGPETGEDGLF